MKLKSLLEQLVALPSAAPSSQCKPILENILNHPDCSDSIASQVQRAVVQEAGWLIAGSDFEALNLAPLSSNAY